MPENGRPSVAFVVQRYGKEVSGGSELACRLLAGRLCSYYNIEVLTTCARDHHTWKNEYRPGEETIDGVRVRRFRVEGERDPARFDEAFERIFWKEHTDQDEHDLLRFQGPYCPELVQYIESTSARYDAMLFFTYLYYPTAMGLLVAGRRVVFMPTAHDEPLLYLRHFDKLFAAAPELIFLTEEERLLLQRRFTLDMHTGTIAGIGVDNPIGEMDEAGWQALKVRLGTSQVVTFVGRVERGKGCDTLIDYFLRVANTRPPGALKLLLLGRKAMEIPDHPAIVAPGFVSDYVKAQALVASTVSVAPSALESLCMAVQEAWLHGCPVLANGHSEVLAGQCARANGGLWYRNYEEFEAALSRLLDDVPMARTLGEQGRDYVRRNCQWSRIERLYRDVLDRVIASRPASGS